MPVVHNVSSNSSVYYVYEKEQSFYKLIVITEDRKEAGAYLGLDKYAVVHANAAIVTQLL
ncbi:hypothetical protein C1876_02835 [Eggerthella sinensis]|uniref:Uncharacterized protein n=1 Tax=Eggerthella sinensis TaxID=242230 RepID=A0A3N0IUX7_9ACTN|nr:hypothetical protein C1876_02835 [Eggerthella sinensis]RNM40773.1 hypothetical protein DMP09_12770 [Eggerthella sinensis]